MVPLKFFRLGEILEGEESGLKMVAIFFVFFFREKLIY